MTLERSTPIPSQRPIHRPASILRIDAARHITMEGGIWPIGHPRNMTMLERVDMDVIHMVAVILLIPDQVFPIMALPDTPNL